jgi:hypothetical protein
VLCAVGSYALNNKVAALAGQTLPQGIIVVGAFLLILSFVGAFSAWKEIRLGLGLYFFFISIITVILFAVGIAVYVKKDQADIYIRQGWMEAGVDTRSSLQAAFFCCGLIQFNHTDDGPMTWPCGGELPDPAPTDPCLDHMLTSFQDNFHTAGSCGIGFSVVMIVSLAITAYLMVGIRESAVNQAIEKNRARNERDLAKNRKKGKVRISTDMAHKLARVTANTPYAPRCRGWYRCFGRPDRCSALRCFLPSRAAVRPSVSAANASDG